MQVLPIVHYVPMYKAYLIHQVNNYQCENETLLGCHCFSSPLSVRENSKDNSKDKEREIKMGKTRKGTQLKNWR